MSRGGGAGPGRADARRRYTRAMTAAMTHDPALPEPAADGTRERLGELDALRGIGALIVMIFHYESRLGPGGLADLWRFEWARYAVQMFFLISGYVILMSARRARTAREFGLRRWARLYPTFWLCAAISYATIRVFDPSYNPISPGMAALNLLMVQLPHFTPIDWTYWTLHQEVLFYLVIAGLMVVRRLDWALWAVAALVVTSLCTLRFTRWFSLFLIGMVMFDSRGGFRPRHAWLLALCAADILRRSVGLPEVFDPLVERLKDSLAALGVRPGPPKGNDVAGWAYPVHVLVVSAAVWCTTRLRLPWLANPVLRFFGAISYPLYLLHMAIGFIIIDKARAAGLGVNAGFWIAVGTSVGLATAVSFGVERPMMRWAAGKARAMRERYATR